jgi:hypothetical protein
VDDYIGTVFRVDFTDVPIPDLREEIGDDPFQVLRLALIDPVEQPFETRPEEVERLAGDGLAQPGAVDGFFNRQADDIRSGGMDERGYLLTKRGVHRQDLECLSAISGNNPRRPMRQSGSNTFRLSRLMFLNGALR